MSGSESHHIRECGSGGRADQIGLEMFINKCRRSILDNILPSNRLGFWTCSNSGAWRIQFDRRVRTWGDVQIWTSEPCCSGCNKYLENAAMLVRDAVRDNIITPPRLRIIDARRYAPTPAPAYAYAPEPERITAQAVSGSSVAPAASAASAHQEPPQKSSEFEGIDTRDFPNEYRCPITMEPMEDPVVCMDGNTYERSAIEEWLERSNKSPMTNVPLTSSMLVPNRVLKCLIREHAERVRKEQSSKLSDESKS